MSILRVRLGRQGCRERERGAQTAHRRAIERDRSPVQLRRDRGRSPDRAPSPAPPRRRARRAAGRRSRIGGAIAGAVVVDREHDARCRATTSRRATRDARPLAGVVEQVAEHLVEVLALAAHGMLGWSTAYDRSSRPRSACRRCSVRASPSADSRTGSARRGGARRRGARVREVIVDLAPHALDLLLDGARRARRGPPPRRAPPPARARRAASSGRARDRRPWRARASTRARDARAARSDRRRAAALPPGSPFDRASRPSCTSSEPRAQPIDRREPLAHLQRGRQTCSRARTAGPAACA